MRLSSQFSIDPGAPWVRVHNEQVRRVMAAYEADKPVRVPLLLGEWTGQHGFYADEIGLDYRTYYGDAEVMLRVQLEAARRRRELPISDTILGEAPERWPASVDFWPVVAPGWVGCRLVQRPDGVIAHEPMRLSKEQADAMPMPDVLDGGILKTCRRFWDDLRKRCEGLSFLGMPIGPVQHGVGTNGLFSLALDIRGEDLMADMYDDPAFAHRFLRKIASWHMHLAQAWDLQASGTGEGIAFDFTDHGIDMLSPDLYEQFLVPVICEMNRLAGTPVPKSLHHCGRGGHLFSVMQRHFGLDSIHALTWPIHDLVKVRRELAEDVRICALITDSIVQQGPAENIRQAVREVMKAKGRGRFCLIVGDMLPGTSMDHRVALYEAVKEFGAY